MTTRQKQDLTIFSDNSVVSPKLLTPAQYNAFLGLITSIDGTSPIWLVNTLIEELLFGKSRLNSHAVSITSLAISGLLDNAKSSENQVIYISFINNLNHLAYYFKKLTGIDLSSDNNSNSANPELRQQISDSTGKLHYHSSLNGRFHFINCFDGLFTDLLSNDVSESSVINFFNKHILQKVANIQQQQPLNTVVLVESPEFLLSATSISPTSLIRKLHQLHKKGQGMFVISGVDEPLIDFNSYNSEQAIEFKVTKFYSHLLHKSNFVVNVKPLSTGRADDISGNLTISRGLVDLDMLAMDGDSGSIGNANGDRRRALEVMEKEYLFYVKKDSTVDLFYK